MKRAVYFLLGAIIVGVLLSAWCPWVTQDFAEAQVKKLYPQDVMDACAYKRTESFKKTSFGGEIRSVIQCSLTPEPTTLTYWISFTGETRLVQ